MDGLQITFICVMVLVVVLLIISFVCYYFGPRAISWLRSNREEKIGLSKSKIFHANGYMIHSGSDFLQLSSTGSFKRFDSIDRDYKQVGQSSITSPSWNIPQVDTQIPPQPLRPAPAPSSNAIRHNIIKQQQVDMKTSHLSEINNYNNSNYSPIIQHNMYHQQIIEKPIKQKSLEYFETSSTSKSTSSPAINITAIPRPVAKRQLSTPIENSFTSVNGIVMANGVVQNGDIPGKINLSQVVSKIQANNNNNNKTNKLYSAACPILTSNNLPVKVMSPKIRRQRLLMEHQQQQLHKISSNIINPTNPFLNGNNIPTNDEIYENPPPASLSSSSSSSEGTTTADNPISHENITKNMKNSICDAYKFNEINLKYSNNRHNEFTIEQTKNSIYNQQIDKNTSLTLKNQKNNSKNPFTADSITEYQRQRQKQKIISSSEDAFDLLPELKEPPKTDLDRFTIFNFEPENIHTILTNHSPKSAIDHFSSKFETNLENDNKIHDKSLNSPKLFGKTNSTESITTTNEVINSEITNFSRNYNTFESPVFNQNQTQQNFNKNISNESHNQKFLIQSPYYRNEITTTAFEPLPSNSENINQNDNNLNKMQQSPSGVALKPKFETRNFLQNRFDSNIDRIINQNNQNNIECNNKSSNFHNNYNSNSVPTLLNLHNESLNEPDYVKNFSTLSFFSNINTLSSSYRNDSAAAKISNILNFQRRASSASQLFSFEKVADFEKQQSEYRSSKSFKLSNGNCIGNQQSPYYSLQKTLFTSNTLPSDKQSLHTSTSNGSIFDYSNGISQLSKYFGLPSQNLHTEKQPDIFTLSSDRKETNHLQGVERKLSTTSSDISINQLHNNINKFEPSVNSNCKYSSTQSQIFNCKEDNFNINENQQICNIIKSPSSPQTLSFQSTSSTPLNHSPTVYNSLPHSFQQSPPSQNTSSPKETFSNNINWYNNNNNSIVKKYLDSPCSDVFDDIEQMIRKRCRNRSHSETEVNEVNDLKIMNRHSNFRRSLNTNPFMEKGTQMLHKTFSENFLAKSIHAGQQQQQQQQQNYQTWCFERTFSRQDSLSFNLGRRNSSQSSLNDSEGGCSLDSLHHAVSCESVNSISSVTLSDLEPASTPVTGQICVGLKFDKSQIVDDCIELNVNVMEAKELTGPGNTESFDTFVRMYLVPDETGARQTKLFKNSTSPCYNEIFSFTLDKDKGRRSLWFHLYHSGNSHTLIGETELQIADVSTARPYTTWLSLSDSRNLNPKWGELMFSLSYLPTAERLTVVVVKGRNFHFEQNANELETQNIFVKVYLLKDNKKISKKKTSLKRKDRCPIFNESMIFSIPPYVLNSIQVRLTVMSASSSDQQIVQQQQQQYQLVQQQSLQQQQYCETLGHVFIGSGTTSKGIKHWNQMLSSLRKPVAMWHPLRKTKPKSGKTSNEFT